MELVRINANLLVALDLLLTEQSVARAAARQGVSPSAMSHSLRALRDLFSDPLLIKTQRGMRPTPYAQSLRTPLRRALHELERAISGGLSFHPETSERGFIIAAPDFLSTQLAGPVVQRLLSEAPGVDVEFRPVQRSGQLKLESSIIGALADGDVDLVAAAVLEGMPDVHTSVLYDERFTCIVRDDHPLADGGPLTLARYAETPQLLITITDERSPSWVDDELHRHGLSRQIAVRTRYFTAAPQIVAETGLLATVPFQLARHAAKTLPIRLFEPPLALPRYQEFLAWHARFDADPGLGWLRALLHSVVDSIVANDPGALAPGAEIPLVTTVPDVV